MSGFKIRAGESQRSGPEDCSISIVLNSDTGSNLMTSFCQDLINPVVVQGLAGRRRASDWEEMSLCPFVFPQEWTKHHAECQTELPPQSKPANRSSPLTSGLKRFWKLPHFVADFIHLTASTVYIVLLFVIWTFSIKCASYLNLWIFMNTTSMCT